MQREESAICLMFRFRKEPIRNLGISANASRELEREKERDIVGKEGMVGQLRERWVSTVQRERCFG